MFSSSAIPIRLLSFFFRAIENVFFFSRSYRISSIHYPSPTFAGIDVIRNWMETPQQKAEISICFPLFLFGHRVCLCLGLYLNANAYTNASYIMWHCHWCWHWLHELTLCAMFQLRLRNARLNWRLFVLVFITLFECWVSNVIIIVFFERFVRVSNLLKTWILIVDCLYEHLVWRASNSNDFVWSEGEIEWARRSPSEGDLCCANKE